MIDLGSGEPVVVIPGLQGRWEWMRPSIEALARRFRVITFSLCDEPTSGFGCESSRGFDTYLDQVGEVMDRARLDRATLVGVSYGGLIAAEFAALQPDRVSNLVLASALPTDWTPNARARFYLRAPLLLSPLFVAGAPLRMRPELRAAFPRLRERVRFTAGHGMRVVTAPTSPVRMARRIQWAEAHRFADASRVSSPALVVTGEPALDRVVPVEASRRSAQALPRARHVVLPRTGHLGIVTRPVRFAEIVTEFLGQGVRQP